MAGLVPAIHAAPHMPLDVDAQAFAAPKRLRPRRRVKPGHGEVWANGVHHRFNTRVADIVM
jgi:hypothetical protein